MRRRSGPHGRALWRRSSGGSAPVWIRGPGDVLTSRSPRGLARRWSKPEFARRVAPSRSTTSSSMRSSWKGRGSRIGGPAMSSSKSPSVASASISSGRRPLRKTGGTIARAAEREFQLLEMLDHPGVLRAQAYTEHELGSGAHFRALSELDPPRPLPGSMRRYAGSGGPRRLDAADRGSHSIRSRQTGGSPRVFPRKAF